MPFLLLNKKVMNDRQKPNRLMPEKYIILQLFSFCLPSFLKKRNESEWKKKKQKRKDKNKNKNRMRMMQKGKKNKKDGSVTMTSPHMLCHAILRSKNSSKKNCVWNGSLTLFSTIFFLLSHHFLILILIQIPREPFQNSHKLKACSQSWISQKIKIDQESYKRRFLCSSFLCIGVEVYGDWCLHVLKMVIKPREIKMKAQIR